MLSCRSTKQNQISSRGLRWSWVAGSRARTHAAILKTERTEDSRDLRNFNSLDSRGAGLAVVSPVSLWLAPFRAESTTAEHRCHDWQLLGRFAHVDHHRIWLWIRLVGCAAHPGLGAIISTPPASVLCTKCLGMYLGTDHGHRILSFTVEFARLLHSAAEILIRMANRAGVAELTWVPGRQPTRGC